VACHLAARRLALSLAANVQATPRRGARVPRGAGMSPAVDRCPASPRSRCRVSDLSGGGLSKCVGQAGSSTTSVKLAAVVPGLW
jgi:hypothetical protein